jgi:hypothetical protein
MKMLKGLNPLLTPDILYALCAMGHGDEVVIVDAHYPADVAARSTVYGKLLRMDGVVPTQRATGLETGVGDASVTIWSIGNSNAKSEDVP